MLRSLFFNQVRFATHKSGGSTSNGRTSQPKYLGFKKMHGAKVEQGNVILRQRGTRWHPAHNVGLGKDHTLFAKISGRVVVWYDLMKQRRFVSVDDGTLGSLPSRVEMKKKLSASIDIPTYLSLDPNGRYDMVMKNVEKITQDLEQAKEAKAVEQLHNKHRRKFDLVDLTQL